ncbi:hypothetical protein Ccrd_010332 [Cynara cardunculus var. scolymus]|uniref:Uncharacterized protein n=1 Tax=Cynara cardunculus var. scolymus TaxID=59895 RepID=A0A103YLK3_CYNCS|nr:hypothetical protein Ccrd_010332 [Cynara cardunculus var. scolymus]
MIDSPVQSYDWYSPVPTYEAMIGNFEGTLEVLTVYLIDSSISLTIAAIFLALHISSIIKKCKHGWLVVECANSSTTGDLVNCRIYGYGRISVLTEDRVLVPLSLYKAKSVSVCDHRSTLNFSFRSSCIINLCKKASAVFNIRCVFNLLITMGTVARLSNTNYTGFAYNVQNVVYHLATNGIVAIPGEKKDLKELEGRSWNIRPSEVASIRVPSRVAVNQRLDRSISRKR